MSLPGIIVVDEDDNVLGSAAFQEAVDDELIRRVVRIFVVSSNGQFLIQKRAEMKKFPGLLDCGAAGHVDANETYEQAAIRESAEEIGIELQPEELHEFGHYYSEAGRVVGSDGQDKKYRAWSKAFYVINDGPFSLQEEEVAEATWLEYEQVKSDTDSNPKAYMSGMLEAMEFFVDKFPNGYVVGERGLEPPQP